MKEIRQLPQQVTAQGRNVTGYAVVFDSLSHDLGGFREIIAADALSGVIEKSDVLCLLNHNADRGILARSKYGAGTLRLELDAKGLKYSFEAPNTPLGDELLEMINRGDISTSSFAFTVEAEAWEVRDGENVRVIERIAELYDVSPVY